MKEKRISLILICSFIVIAGICYSCSYGDGKSRIDLEENDNLQSEQIKLNENVSEVAYETTENTSGKEELQVVTKQGELEIEDTKVKVHICGAVLRPGVYEVVVAARVVDLIDLAGGFTELAAGDYINQAMPIADGLRIYIPTLEEVKEVSVFTEYGQDTQEQISNTKESLININTANEQVLMTLPGIGEAKSKKIVEYRKSNGDFKAIEDLMNIPGIKEGLFEQISSFVAVK